MDIVAFATADETQVSGWLHVRDMNNELAYSTDETGKPDKTKPVRIELLGKDSEPYRREIGRQLRISQQKQQQMNGKYIKPFSEIESDNRRVLSAVTVSVENLQAGGRELTADDADYIYKVAPHIAEQVTRFLDDRANFLRGSLAA